MLSNRFFRIFIRFVVVNRWKFRVLAGCCSDPTTMRDNAGTEIVVGRDASLASTRRSNRMVRPAMKVLEDRDNIEDAATLTRRITRNAVRASSTEIQSSPNGQLQKSKPTTETGKTFFLRVLEELKELKDASIKQQELIRDLQQQEATREQQLHELVHELQQQVIDTKEELERVREQLEESTRLRSDSPLPGGTQVSYADIVRNPGIQPRDTLNGASTQAKSSKSLFCTVGPSRKRAEDDVQTKRCSWHRRSWSTH